MYFEYYLIIPILLLLFWLMWIY